MNATVNTYENSYASRFITMLHKGIEEAFNEKNVPTTNLITTSIIEEMVRTKSVNGKLTNDIMDLEELYKHTLSLIVALGKYDHISRLFQRADDEICNIGKKLARRILEKSAAVNSTDEKLEGLDILEQLTREFGFIFNDDDEAEPKTESDAASNAKLNDLNDIENQHYQYLQERARKSQEIVRRWIEELFNLTVTRGQAYVDNMLGVNLNNEDYINAMVRGTQNAISSLPPTASQQQTLFAVCAQLFARYCYIYEKNAVHLDVLSGETPIKDVSPVFRYYRKRYVISEAIATIVEAYNMQNDIDLARLYTAIAWFANKIVHDESNNEELNQIPAIEEFEQNVENLQQIAAEMLNGW